MASSSCSQSKHLSVFNITSGLLTLFLLVTYVTATRPGVTLMEEGKALTELKIMKTHRRLYDKSFLSRDQMFNFFPKGTPMPPSGPSKRHNSVQN